MDAELRKGGLPQKRRHGMAQGAVVRIAAMIIACAAGEAYAASPQCSANGVQITSVAKVGSSTSGATPFVLNDRLRLQVDKPDVLFSDGQCIGKLAIFLNDKPLEGDEPILTGEKGVIEFPLSITSQSRKAWDDIFANALAGGWQRVVGVNLGFIGSGVIPQDKPFTITMNLFPWLWTTICGVLLAGFAVCLTVLGRKSGLLKDPPPPADTIAVVDGRLDRSQPPPATGPYSMARSQGAWWLAIISASYLFIGVVTGDFVTSFSSTAVILLGIGAGTVVCGTIISQQKLDDQLAKAKMLESRVTELSELRALDGRKAILSGAELARYTVLLAKYPDINVGQALDTKISRLSEDYAVATNQGSRNYLIDVLSDANGISFARFQLFAWTVVLGVVFLVSVLQSLTMPVFDTTLMGLIGLSSATYLGLKIPEPTVPKER